MSEEKGETKIYHMLVVGMAAILILVMGWVGVECSHIPVIEEEISAIERNISETTTWQTHKLGEHDAQLSDHEKRIQRIEDAEKQ